MHFFEPFRLLTMSRKRNNKPELGRRKFEDIITDSLMDYLFDKGMPENFPSSQGEFMPIDTPNRNPEQVPDGLWGRLLYKHLNKHFYN